MNGYPVLESAPVVSRLSRCPNYAVTPLRCLTIDGGVIWAKDETERMGLGSFKALGGAYAALRLIEQRGSSDITFVTASAGNHGLSVAAGAKAFGARARVHVATSVSEAFVARLRAEGAEVVRSGNDYEASVAAAIVDAEETGATHLADGSWPGYTEAPRLVMEGYTVIAEELSGAFEREDVWPDVVYVQAGVGGLAAAMADRIRASWEIQPRIVVVEPEAAPCLGESARAGRIVTVEGPASMMGRLDCKVPSMLALTVLAETVDNFVTVSDAQAAQACGALLAAGIATTSSGAAGLAACSADPTAASCPLIIVTEGPEDI